MDRLLNTIEPFVLLFEIHGFELKFAIKSLDLNLKHLFLRNLDNTAVEVEI